MSTIIPLADVDPQLVEELLDAAFEPERRQRTAYRLREGLEWLPGLSFAALDDEDMLAGTIQCWPVALTTLEGRRVPMIMVGPVAVMPGQQGRGYGKALVTASLTAIDPRAPLPQVMIGDPEYYERFFRFQQCPHRRLAAPRPVRAAPPAVPHRQSCRSPGRRRAGALAGLIKSGTCEACPTILPPSWPVFR